MHLVDIVLVILVVLAAANGYRRGALLQLASFGGIMVGIAVAALLAVLLGPSLAALSQNVRTVLALVVFVVCLAGGETAGFSVGRVIRRRMRSRAVTRIDRVLGMPLAAVATLFLAWVVAGIFVASPMGSMSPALTYDIRHSTVLRETSRLLPFADDALGPLRHFLGANRLPLPLPPFESPDSEPVTVDPALAGAPGVSDAASSVFMVRGRACSQEIEGSGWIVRDGYMVTNAHVVAGVDRPKVIQGPKANDATVTYFDPDTDIAILHVPGVKARPLALSESDPAPRTSGATIGFPGGGKQVIAAAAVRTTASTRTADIYGYPGVVREVVFFKGDVRPGSSGGALVDAKGKVIGVVFATSAVGGEDDYALAPSAVRKAIDEGTSRTAAVSSGRCA